VLLCFRLPEQLAKKPTIDELSAKLEVLQAEHDSLQEFLKKSSEKETKEKKEREEKHAQDIAELGDKLKKSNARIKTLVAKAKASETEADGIDKLIFRRNFCLFPASSC
jgi:ABC-type Fe3+-citrate transport system substrate-binding protein